MQNLQSQYLEGSGQLLTRNQYDVDGGCVFELWIKNTEGVFQLLVEGQKLVCFVESKNAQTLYQISQPLVSWLELNELELQGFQGQKMTAIYTRSLKDYFGVKRAAQEHQIELFESDIRPVDRFLMERFIKSDLTFAGYINAHTEQSFQTVRNVQVKTSEPIESQSSLLSVDIECDERGYLYSIGLQSFDKGGFELVLFNCEESKAIVHSTETPAYIEWLNGERALLQRLNQVIYSWDPDYIVGWAFIGFDVRALDGAAKRNHIQLKWGRDKSAVNFIDGERDSGRSYPHKAYVSGRVLLDGIAVMKDATYQFDSFSLNSVATELLGESKLITEEKGLDKLKEIKRQYRDEPLALAEYNLQDCKLVAAIFDKEKLIDFLLIRSRLTGLELDRVGGSVAAFTNLYMPRVHRQGFVAPNLVSEEDYLHSPGGFVMESKPGIHQDVLVFDFKSLYPSIIRTFNVDPVRLVQGLVAEQDATIEGFRGGRFTREKSILSNLLDELWAARELAKQQDNKILSNAIKIIMNSFYGVLGSAGCRFYDTRLASSITMRGHWVLNESKIWFEQKGLEVIYGDTDSIFVKVKANKDMPAEAKALESELNLWWQRKLQEEFKLESKLEMEFETHFSPFYMPTIRGSDSGSKKRYVGMKNQPGRANELVFKGMESVRSDWTDLAKHFQIELFKRIFAKQNVDELLNDTLHQLYAGELDARLIYKKRLRRHLEEYVKTTPPQVKAARMANKVYGREMYRKGSHIRYLMTTSGPIEHSMVNAPLDYQFYVDKQIFPICEQILKFYSPSSLSVFSQQLKLL